MQPNEIWWNKVTNASNLLNQITYNVKDENSVILQLPISIPWYDTMNEIVEEKLSRKLSEKTIDKVSALQFPKGGDFGEYLFNNYCKEEKRAKYRPSKSYAEFLAESEDIVLNDRIVWITDCNLETTKSCYDFIASYYKAIPSKQSRCIFVIETVDSGDLQEKKNIKIIKYSDQIEQYDYDLFNMMIASQLKGNLLYKKYISELASLLFRGDVELASLCISDAKNFIKNPKFVLEKINNEELRSNGNDFEFTASEEFVNKCIWEAQIRIVFPLLERQRNFLVNKYYDEISSVLPFETNYEVISEPGDAELSLIWYLGHSGKIEINNSDYKFAGRLKQDRNILAHLGTLDLEELDYIFSL